MLDYACLREGLGGPCFLQLSEIRERRCVGKRMSDRKQGKPLWWVRRIDGSAAHLFVGDLHAMVRHINTLHLATGVQHCARELDGS